MKKYLLLLSFCCFLTAKAQTPYSTLKLNSPQYFRGWNPISAAFFVQSPISVLHFNATVQQSGMLKYIGFGSPYDTSQTVMTCIEDNGKSWYGTTAARRANDIEVYTNIQDDSIYYDPMAGVGKTFRMFDYPGGDYINATVDSLVFTTTPAFADSVKWLSMQRFNAFGVPVADAVNGKQIAVARDSGWVQFFAADYFPQTWIPMTRVAWQARPDRYAVYNFSVGDTFQYRYQVTQVMGSNLPPAYEEKVVLSKQYFNGGDSVEYIFQRKNMSFTYSALPTPHLDTTFSQTLDTTGYGGLLAPLWTVWPMESYYLTSLANPEVAYTLLDTGFCGTSLVQTLITGTFQYFQGLSCYPTPFEPVILQRSYAANRGEVYYGDDARSIGGTLTEKTLVWSSVGNVSCGQHVTFTGLTPATTLNFSLSPNPAGDYVQIQSPNIRSSVEYQMFTPDGKLLAAKVRNMGDEIRFELSGLPAGVYLIRGIASGLYGQQRFVKF